MVCKTVGGVGMAFRLSEADSGNTRVRGSRGSDRGRWTKSIWVREGC